MAKIVAENSYTDSELLALVREAIAKLMAGGQSYDIGGQSFTRADLGMLRTYAQELEYRINEASTGGIAWGKVSRRRAT